ncbi:MAG: BBP7 family outer membrane beta-barrel protein [Planctomycetes bacterium]|nr:BBP7 family outer membrane beta-barrel protein [Planctomycetota bacterium]
MRSFFSCKRTDRPVAESAEDAEAFAAATRKPQRLWVRGEYMIWWIKAANFAPLVTTGDFTEPAPGALNSLSTSILFGGNGMDFADRRGGRFSAGWWFDDEQSVGLEAGYFFLAGRSVHHVSISPGNPVLANPFFNVNTGQPDSSLVSYPGIMSGQIAVDAPSFLQGAEVNLSAALWRNERVRFELLAGFRYVNLSERLTIDESSLVQLAPQFVGLTPLDGNTITTSDRFDAQNHFYGGQLGTRVELNHKRWTLSVLAKVALGASREIVSIRGNTSIDTTPAFNANGGLYAVSSNSGAFTRNTFAVVPEAGINLEFRLTERVRVFGGYTFLYWSNVVRPGDQIDTTVNLNFVPTSMTFGAVGGPARPAFAFRSTDFFAHGANVGLEFRY